MPSGDPPTEDLAEFRATLERAVKPSGGHAASVELKPAALKALVGRIAPHKTIHLPGWLALHIIRLGDK